MSPKNDLAAEHEARRLYMTVDPKGDKSQMQDDGEGPAGPRRERQEGGMSANSQLPRRVVWVLPVVRLLAPCERWSFWPQGLVSCRPDLQTHTATFCSIFTMTDLLSGDCF